MATIQCGAKIESRGTHVVSRETDLRLDQVVSLPSPQVRLSTIRIQRPEYIRLWLNMLRWIESTTGTQSPAMMGQYTMWRPSTFDWIL